MLGFPNSAAVEEASGDISARLERLLPTRNLARRPTAYWKSRPKRTVSPVHWCVDARNADVAFLVLLRVVILGMCDSTKNKRRDHGLIGDLLPLAYYGLGSLTWVKLVFSVFREIEQWEVPTILQRSLGSRFRWSINWPAEN